SVASFTSVVSGMVTPAIVSVIAACSPRGSAECVRTPIVSRRAKPSHPWNPRGVPARGAARALQRLQQDVQLFVALDHAVFHARRQQPVAGLEGRADGPAPQPAAAVAEVLEPHELDVD